MNFDLVSDYDRLADMFDLYAEHNPTWGSLHVVLDDGNIDRSSVGFCHGHALEKRDFLGAFLAEVLLEFIDDELGKT